MHKETMLDYVALTPATLRRQLDGKYEEPLTAAFCRGKYHRVRIVASGSSRNAALLVRHYLRKWLRMEVLVTEPFTFCSYESECPEDEFVFAVSQSGYSSNAIAALQSMKAAGIPAIGVTADVKSDFRLYADLLIDYGAGEETVGYVTNGVTALSMFLCLFALSAAAASGKIQPEELQTERRKLYALVESYERMIPQAEPLLRQRYRQLSDMKTVYLVGAGPAFGAACEGALKLGETVQVTAVAYELEEFLHGPELQLRPDYTLFFLASGETASARAACLQEAARKVTDRVFFFTDQNQEKNADLCVFGEADELLRPLCFLPFFQVASFLLTEELHRWYHHPLVKDMEETVNGKTENYISKEVL